MWKRDFPSVYTAIKDQWSPAIQPIITALQGDRGLKWFHLSYSLSSPKQNDLLCKLRDLQCSYMRKDSETLPSVPLPSASVYYCGFGKASRNYAAMMMFGSSTFSYFSSFFEDSCVVFSMSIFFYAISFFSFNKHAGILPWIHVI